MAQEKKRRASRSQGREETGGVRHGQLDFGRGTARRHRWLTNELVQTASASKVAVAVSESAGSDYRTNVSIFR